MLRKSEFEGKAKKIYDKNKNDWESKYYGKVIAIDLDAEKLIAVADSLFEVDKSVDRLCPDHKVLVRRVGDNPTVARVLRE
ncbi:MAG: hypothetical protein Q7J35_19190 [Candidatus Methanoperedens sp.]|nr:hypothetical protein [Candidatus Methanoperedens sp.]